MNSKQKHWPLLQCSTLALAGLMGAAAPAFAQDGTKSMTDKWRPKDGIYAAPDEDIIRQCRDSVGVIVSLSEKRSVATNGAAKSPDLPGPHRVRSDWT